jgi:hypothetical protein
MIKCEGRISCPEYCIYEHEKIWCACYDAPNIHMWWHLQKLVVNHISDSYHEVDE